MTRVLRREDLFESREACGMEQITQDVRHRLADIAHGLGIDCMPYARAAYVLDREYQEITFVAVYMAAEKCMKRAPGVVKVRNPLRDGAWDWYVVGKEGIAFNLDSTRPHMDNTPGRFADAVDAAKKCGSFAAKELLAAVMKEFK